jgi:hypothetical protein
MGVGGGVQGFVFIFAEVILFVGLLGSLFVVGFLLRFGLVIGFGDVSET